MSSRATSSSSRYNSPSVTEPPAKRLRSSSTGCKSPTGTALKVHIVQAKLDSQDIYDLFSLVDTGNLDGVLLQRCPDINDADVVVTAVRMRRRLERHLDWTVATSKAIVTPQWLFDSVKQGKALPTEDYAALQGLHDDTSHSNSEHPKLSTKDAPAPSTVNTIASPSSKPRPKTNIRHTSRFACCRASPLICPNPGLIAELAVIRRSRDLEGEDRSALSYSRAISVIKAYPHVITEKMIRKEVSKLPYIGPKIQNMLYEYVAKESIDEAQSILATTRYHSLVLFTTVYGIGPTNARKLYDLGLRDIQDMEHYFDAPSNSSDIKLGLEDADVAGNDVREQLTIKVALALREELTETIPRDEVTEMHRIVMGELESVQSGCTSTIVGGYRRGKLESNDVDIVITHPDLRSGTGIVKGLSKKLVKRLYEKGLVTHVMRFHRPNALRTAQWDSLEKALTVFIFPATSTARHIHRRLDLIFAAPEVYWTAVTGWTGSTMFERDLRLWAKGRGMKFDSSGITRRRDSKAYYPRTEREVFDMLGLEWIEPIQRNADA